jgi:hypothetical protein
MNKFDNKNLNTLRASHGEQSKESLCAGLDKVGIRTKFPDGIEDSCVLMEGVPINAKIVNITLTDEVFGKTWSLNQSANNERFLAYEKIGASIILYFYNPYLAPYIPRFKQYIKSQKYNFSNKLKWKDNIVIRYHAFIELDNGIVVEKSVNTRYPTVLPLTGKISDLSNTKLLFLNKKNTINNNNSEGFTYQSIMSSCLKNLLANFPINGKKQYTTE